MRNADKPAFVQCEDTTMKKSTLDVDVNYGLTKREYFAAMAMQGFLSGCSSPEGRKILYDQAKGYNQNVSQFVAEVSKQMADDMLTELDK